MTTLSEIFQVAIAFELTFYLVIALPVIQKREMNELSKNWQSYIV